MPTTRQLTCKQKQLIIELPKNKFILNKSAIKAGYAKNYANTALYRDVRRNKMLEKCFSVENVKEELKEALKNCKNSKDYTNTLRAIELMSKILGMQIDKTQNQTEVIVKEEEKSEVNRLRNGILPAHIQ